MRAAFIISLNVNCIRAKAITFRFSAQKYIKQTQRFEKLKINTYTNIFFFNNNNNNNHPV